MVDSLGRSPTVQTLVAFVVVFAAQQITALALGVRTAFFLFAVAEPLTVNPWTLVTSVYAHASVGHLLANSFAVILLGAVLERNTTTARFHAFFVISGAIAGGVQAALAPSTAVLGASGAAFALLGYLVTGNPVTDAIFGYVHLDWKVEAALFVFLAIVVTVATAAPRVALLAHFTGFIVGLTAGRFRLLAVKPTAEG